MARKNDKNDKPTREEKIAAKIAENKAALIQAHSDYGQNVTKVCEAVGLNRETYYRYQRDDGEFKAACEEAKHRINDEAVETIVTLMRESRQDKVKLDAAKSILSAQAKDQGWGTERRVTEHSGSVDLNAKVEKVRFELPDNRTDAGTEPPKPPGWETATSGG